MYDIHDYGDMIADQGRTDAYARALRARVGPETVVLDIGAGAGILTLLACQAGARRVYAVEPDSLIQVAREAAAANGYADRVEFIQGFTTEIDLPEKVDLIVADVHGILPFCSGSVTSILDARDRFLKPGGTLIPQRETVWAAIVTAPERHRQILDPWGRRQGLDFTAGRRRAVNRWNQWRAAPDSLLVEPKSWAVLDYATLHSPSASGRTVWTVARDGEAHGLCLWFDCDTAPGCGFSNAPGVGEERVYQQGFFSWPEAQKLDAGDEVAVEFRADAIGEHYVWSWNSEIRGTSGRAKAQYRQSTFLNAPVSKDWLRKSGASFVPSPNHEAAIDKMILDLLFTGISLEEISRRLSERFPARFPDWRKALTRVGNLSLRYSR